MLQIDNSTDKGELKHLAAALLLNLGQISQNRNYLLSPCPKFLCHFFYMSKRFSRANFFNISQWNKIIYEISIIIFKDLL